MSQLLGSLVWASGLTPLGSLLLRPLQRHFHFLGLTAGLHWQGPTSPCQPTQALAESIFSHFWNPYPTFPGEVHDFYGCLYAELGHPYGGFPDFGYLDPCRTQAPYLRFAAQSGNFGPPSLGYSIMGHQVMVTTISTHKDSFPHPVTSSSGSVPMATNSKHSHSRLSDCDSGPYISTKSANINQIRSLHPEIVKQNLGDIANSNSGHVCHSPQHAFSTVYVFDSGASSSGDSCSVRLAGAVDVQASTFSPAQQVIQN